MTELEARIAALPLWQGRPEITPMLGGLSNSSFVVADRSGRYAVRVGGDFPVHGVFRTREVEVARAAHAAGFAPELVYDEPGLMVSRFIEGRVFRAEDVRANIEPLARLLRRFHTEMAARVPGGIRFSVFDVVKGYAEALRTSGNPLAQRLPELLAANAALEAAQPPVEPAFAHHDLLPANLIDDGKRLWLIDFEYAAPGDALFDLGGLSSNAEFDAGQSELLLAAYFGGEPTAGMRAAHAGMACASLLREALWALVSELHLSAPGADYDAYARENLERFDAAISCYRHGFATAAD